jgi:hypothetical protein
MAVAAALATAGALAMAAPAPAATVTVTGDAGAPVALTPGAPLTMRNMKFELVVGLVPPERAYAVSVAGPAGANGTARSCSSSAVPMPLDYQGNGAYTATVTTYTDLSCRTGAKAATYSWVVSASTAIGAPGGKLLTRKPGDPLLREYTVPVDVNPGALSTQLYFRRGGAIGPDGGLPGAEERFVDQATGSVSLRFEKPGTYLMVALGTGHTGAAGQFFTPYSAPVRVRLLAPFDFVTSPYLSDSRGPRYTLKGTIREKSARGKVRIQMARKGGKWYSIGSAKIRRGGKITKSFTQGNTGKYRVRFIYKGSKTVTAGRVTGSIRFYRF